MKYSKDDVAAMVKQVELPVHISGRHGEGNSFMALIRRPEDVAERVDEVSRLDIVPDTLVIMHATCERT